MSDDIILFPKEVPPDGMLLWRFVGYSNIILSNGEAWKRHSRIVRSALNRNVPLEGFATLARKLFRVMGDGGRKKWDDLTMRFTLDAVGTTALGHDFNAIQDAESPFVLQYNHVMESIANPAYLVFPTLEKIVPRVKTIEAIDNFSSSDDNESLSSLSDDFPRHLPKSNTIRRRPQEDYSVLCPASLI